MHKRLKTLYKLSGYLSPITEPHSLAVAVPLIYPTRISSKHLVVEGVTPVCAHTDGREYLRADFAIIRAVIYLDPLVFIALLGHLNLSLIPLLNLEHGFPRSAYS
jgi:hypothetical protein